MEEKVDELIMLYEERPYACHYNMKPREYRNRKIFALGNIATALSIIVTRSLDNYRVLAAVTRLHLSLLGEVRSLPRVPPRLHKTT